MLNTGGASNYLAPALNIIVNYVSFSAHVIRISVFSSQSNYHLRALTVQYYGSGTAAHRESQ